MKKSLLITTIVLSLFGGCDNDISYIEVSGPARIDAQTDSVGVFSVVLNGDIDLPNDLESDFRVGIQYCINDLFSEIGTTTLEATDIHTDNTFSVSLNNCIPGQKYYYRTYLYYKDKYIFSKTQTFTTQTVLLNTGIIDSVSLSVNNTVNVEQWSSHDVKYGVCYGLNSNPTINDNIQTTTELADNQFLIEFDKLTFDTLYYRSFILVDGVIAYYGNIRFIKDDIIISDYDPNLYMSVSYNTFRPYDHLNVGICYGPNNNPTIDDGSSYYIKSDSLNSTDQTLFAYPYYVGSTFYRGCVWVDDTIIYGPTKMIELNEKELYVDLGLSVNWAVCNLGAKTSSETGYYYAWGEVEPKTEFNIDNYKWADNSKYGRMSKTYLDLEDDAAFYQWGKKWRMPTLTECDELKNNTWVETIGDKLYLYRSNIKGYEDRFIIVPIATYYKSFWTNTINTTYEVPYSFPNYNYLYKNYDGLPIRAVTSSNSWTLIPVLNVEKVSITTDSYISLSVSLKNGNIDYYYLKDSIEWSSSSPSVATIGNDGTVHGISVGTTIVTAKFRNNTDSCTIVVKEYEPVCDYVDLGLSVKWATCNIGAESPTGYGRYYSWGEIITKNDYSWSSYRYYEETNNTITKYNSDDEIATLEVVDDVAQLLWGKPWRLPTIDEINELYTNCSFTKESMDGIDGYLIKSNVAGFENRSIFIPCAGVIIEDGYQNEINSYYRDYRTIEYWSSSLYTPSQSNDCAYIFREGIPFNYQSRYAGLPIRPVYP